MGYWDDEADWDLDFAEPGSNSALRAATTSNPRNCPCPTCGHPNRLTPADVDRGYQCNRCADAMEQGGEIDYYEPEEEESITPELIRAHTKLTFEVLYEPCSATVTVEDWLDGHRVIVAFPNNQSMTFTNVGEITDRKVTFEREGYYASVVVDLDGSLV